MKKILIIAGYTPSLINFRGDLIKEMVKRGNHVITVGPEDGYEQEIQELGARFLRFPLERAGMNPVKDLISIVKMYQLIKQVKPDIVIGYTIKPVIYGSIAAWLRGVRSIFSMVTGLGYVFLSKGLKGMIIRKLSQFLYLLGLGCCRKVFFQNPDDLNEFVKFGLIREGKCVLVNGSGVNIEKFQTAPVPANTVFLMICRILKDKGVMEYLQAARKVKESCPDARFQLLGPFDANPASLKYEDIQPYIEDGSVEYLGETKDVRPYIENCSVYVLPSYREGTPRTVLEAMAMGRSVITTDAPGCRETVVDGLNGFLVPVQSVNILAEKMIWMINNKTKVLEMSQESPRICHEKYDVRKVNEKVLAAMDL